MLLNVKCLNMCVYICDLGLNRGIMLVPINTSMYTQDSSLQNRFHIGENNFVIVNFSLDIKDTSPPKKVKILQNHIILHLIPTIAINFSLLKK